VTEPPVDCSIVIPVHNRAPLTRCCLDALLEQELPGTEIVVVDDASTDATPEVLERYAGRVRVVRLAVNTGFARACNAGVEAARGPLLALLNNDTVPTAGWLEALIDYRRRHPSASVVGGKLLWPDNTVQHAGVAIDHDRNAFHLYAGLAQDHPAVNRSRPMQVVTAACMLVAKECFQRHGGFDPAFHNGYEDVDFCLRLGEDEEVHYCHRCVVYHLESATRGWDNAEDDRNHDLFMERWFHRLRPDHLDYYVEDGLVRIGYEGDRLLVEVSPLLGRAATGDGGEVLERLLTLRSHQHFDLVRENITLRAAAGASWPAP
jgi:GT2 family glycosyltransferase